MFKIRLPELSEVTFTHELQDEDLRVEGNAMASGDEDTDREANAWIYDQLQRGNNAAWCCLAVTATWGPYQETSYLGCCSYESEKALLDELLPDWKHEAYLRLRSAIEADFAKLAARIELYPEILTLARQIIADDRESDPDRTDDASDAYRLACMLVPEEA